jgi:hypothetical protein
MSDVFPAAGKKIVDRDDFMTIGQKPVGKMRSDEPRSPRN